MSAQNKSGIHMSGFSEGLGAQASQLFGKGHQLHKHQLILAYPKNVLKLNEGQSCMNIDHVFLIKWPNSRLHSHRRSTSCAGGN